MKERNDELGIKYEQLMTLPGEAFGLAESSVVLTHVTMEDSPDSINTLLWDMKGNMIRWIKESNETIDYLEERVEELKQEHPQGKIVILPSLLFLQFRKDPNIGRVLLVQNPTDVYLELYDGRGGFGGAMWFPYDQATKPEMSIREPFRHYKYDFSLPKREEELPVSIPAIME